MKTSKAQPTYYSTRDVQRILSVSRTTANHIMHMFEHNGQLLRHGNTMRVKVETFNEWCRQHTQTPNK